MAKPINMSNIKIFRYKYDYWSEFEERVKTNTGFVAGLSYGDAADRLVSIVTHPNGDYDIHSMELYEIDSYDKGILEDDCITETFEVEKALEKKNKSNKDIEDYIVKVMDESVEQYKSGEFLNGKLAAYNEIYDYI